MQNAQNWARNLVQVAVLTNLVQDAIIQSVRRAKPKTKTTPKQEVKPMKSSVYVGKSADKAGSYEMCLVIDSKISDASALVYNIAKNTIEVLPFGMWHRQAQVFQEICE
jgi:hypothetical protein